VPYRAPYSVPERKGEKADGLGSLRIGPFHGRVSSRTQQVAGADSAECHAACRGKRRATFGYAPQPHRCALELLACEVLNGDFTD